jgi:hypothetical protein
MTRTTGSPPPALRARPERLPADLPQRTPGNRPRRTSAGLLGLAAVTGLLVACDKPQPTVTFFSGSKSDIVSAQPPCVLAGTCGADEKKVAVVGAAGGSRILVDVGKDLSRAGWIVAAYTVDGAGKNTPIQGAGSEPVNGAHTVRLQVPSATSGRYFLQVTSLRPNNQLTTWIARVQLTQ